MIKRVASLLSLMLIVGYAFAQSGRISGTITDSKGETVPFANVVVYQNGVQKAGTTTDFDGNYVIAPLNPGQYDVKVSFVGYPTSEIKGVVVSQNKTTRLPVELVDQGTTLEEIVIVTYEVPLIDPDNTTTGDTKTAEEIRALPTRNINTMATTTGAVYSSDDNGSINVKGARDRSTQYYVNGVKMLGGAPSIPVNAIEQMNIMTGGLSAQYGDVTGGVISITTKGAAKEYSGGIEAETSIPFDQWDQSLVGVSFMGPIWSKSTGDTTNPLLAKETKLGFFLSGQFQHAKDPRPSALGVWKVKDGVYDDLLDKPLVKEGSGYAYKAERLTKDDFEKVKVRPNTQNTSYQLNGAFDFQATDNMMITLGGSFDHRNSSNNVFEYMLFNYENNPQRIDNNYNIYARVRQNFANAQESDSTNSLIKNAYYQLQFDYTKESYTIQDPGHKDNLFRYGHVGNFDLIDGYFAPNYIEPQLAQGFISQYTYSIDSVADERIYTDNNGNILFRTPNNDSITVYSQAGYDFEGISFKPSEFNPYAANYISHYEELNGGIGSIDDFSQNGLFLNGGRARLLYGLWYGPGREYNGYQINNDDQFRVSGLASADIGKHNVKFGFEFEQRRESDYTINPIDLWNVARSKVNERWLGPDFLGTLNVTTQNNEYFITWNDVWEGDVNDPQYKFATELRKKLGVANDQLVNIDNVNPEDLSLDMFSADELWQNQIIGYKGYDYLGNRKTGNIAFEDFFTDTLNRPQMAFSPIYTAFFIEDKFEISDLIVRVGFRVDRFDANQKVLKDRYSFVDGITAGEIDINSFKNGSTISKNSIEDDWVVYTSEETKAFNGSNANNYNIIGFRDGKNWYDRNGEQVEGFNFLRTDEFAGVTKAYVLHNPNRLTGDEARVYRQNVIMFDAFEDYKPQINFLPRVAFSFPISEDASFFAHYDVLTQRPNRIGIEASDFYYVSSGRQSFMNNSNLKPEKQIKYQLGFQQRLSQSSALKIEAFYNEMRDMVGYTQVSDAYPNTYNTFDNIDFGTSKGAILTFDLRRTNRVQMKANYTLSFADGTGSGDATQQNIIDAGFPNLKNTIPLDFDQRHAVKLTFDYRFAHDDGPVLFGKKIFQNFGANLALFAGSGTPYSKNRDSKTSEVYIGVASQSSLDGSVNGSRLPWNFRASLRLDKDFNIGKNGHLLNVYIYVQNLFNNKNILKVYRNTGSPDDDGYLTSGVKEFDEYEYNLYQLRLMDYQMYSLPRRTRIGVSYSF